MEEAEKAVLNDESKAAAIKVKQQRIFEIEDKEKILAVKEQIKAEITKAKQRDAYDKVKRSTSTTAITRLNNEICSSGSIGRIQEFFNSELEKLGFNHFKINALTKGAKGNQNFSIQLSGNNTNIIDIASEGEQKCISLHYQSLPTCTQQPSYYPVQLEHQAPLHRLFELPYLTECHLCYQR
ncbi:hypothetical protein [Vibrio vulnificus]|uniref:hypothetical protein n=1 Tax=Vibrio vulnificus TaxID=672 RepID=UPI00051D43D8|nr:hypothetical protein [Vibrio vulnificus]KGK68557.1 hypothetical protein NA76_20515 [Vibrio vulnificus]